MAIPALLGYGSCAENLLFRVFLRRVVVGKELVGVWVFSEHLRCHGNSTMKTFFSPLQTQLALPSWIRRSPADLKGTKQNFY